MYRVLFVCSGNTCRSPIAAGVFNKLLKERRVRNVVAESAGTVAVNGMRASPLAVSVAGKRGVNLTDHRSRPASPELLERASLVLTMTGQQWYDVTEHVPREKVTILTQFGQSDVQPTDIADPAGGAESDYERVFEQLNAEVTRSFPAILEALKTVAASQAHGGRRR